MPHYFFDVFDGEQFWEDDFGVDLADLYHARAQAQSLLPDLAREKMPDGDRRDVSVVVRCHEGRCRYKATLSLIAEWVAPPDCSDPS